MLKSFLVSAALAATFAAHAALALPQVLQISATDDDATVNLQVPSKYIVGDSRTWCRMQYSDAALMADFTAGDTVTLSLIEDDNSLNEFFWTEILTAPGPGPLAQEFDCSSPFVDEGDGGLEVFAYVRVDKDSCGWTCRSDEPETGLVHVQAVEDDAYEPNDAFAAPAGIGTGDFMDLVARNDDWFRVTTDTPSNMAVLFRHDGSSGLLDLGLYAADGNEADWSVTLAGDLATYDLRAIPAGDWYIHVAPLVTGDYNFYDLSVAVTVLECLPGAVDDSACGDDGVMSRTCGAEGVWGEWGECVVDVPADATPEVADEAVPDDVEAAVADEGPALDTVVRDAATGADAKADMIVDAGDSTDDLERRPVDSGCSSGRAGGSTLPLAVLGLAFAFLCGVSRRRASCR